MENNVMLSVGNSFANESGRYRGRAFVADKDAILAALTERHGFPHPHP